MENLVTHITNGKLIGKLQIKVARICNCINYKMELKHLSKF